MKSILSISFVLLLFASCKKSKNDFPAPTGPATAKVKTLVMSKGIAIINAAAYEYDNSGRVSKVTYKDGNSLKYNYTSTMVTTESFTSAGISDGKSTFTLNAAGLATTYFDNADAATVTNFTYNTAKQLVSAITVNNDEMTNQLYHKYDAAGNIMADSIFTGKVYTSRKIDYYTDKISTIENPNFGINFYGVANTNSPKQSSLKISTSTYTHVDFNIPETDSQGRIIKSVYTTQGSTYTIAYTYY